MKPLGYKEKKDLFFQYLLLFTLTVGLFLFALYFTQHKSNDMVSERDREMYVEFRAFDKMKPAVVKLIDTVTAEANKINTQNGGGSFAIANANGLINDFISSRNINKANNPFLINISELLTGYIKSTSEGKQNEDQIVARKKELEDCSGDLKNKPMMDLLKQQAKNETP